MNREQVEELLVKADQASGDQRLAYTLDAIDKMLALRDYPWAQNTLNTIFPPALSDDHYFTYSLLSARTALAEGEHFIAKRHLWEERFIKLLASQAIDVQLFSRDLRATLLCDIAEYRECISERITIDTLYEKNPEQLADERDLNQDLTWLALMELPLKDLQMESQMQKEPILRGWYTLARLSKDNQTNMRMQLQSVESWAQRWPEHPASLRLPADLQLLKQLVEEQARQIAVLLPLTGKLSGAADAIRDGMMAAFYETATSSDKQPDLRFYDTSSKNINELYDQVVLEGAQVVIGPLDKDKIDELALRPALAVPTLALNYPENPVGDTLQLFQFGLAVEDEAKQVAVRAWRDGMRRAMVLAPANPWGDRGAQTFIEQWQYMGGSLAGDYRFKSQKDYSNLVRDAMDVSDSQARASRIRQILGQALEAEPRPRKDIDLIFLMAHPSQARQIKPILAFHYAGDIPVYSTSYIYNGEIDSNADRDMNGIRFATLPWFFNEALPEKQAIDKHSTRNSAYQRLYALGVDAFHLYPRLRQLDELRNARYYGSTGTLSLDDHRRVVREQTWAQFIRGRAYATPTVAYQDDI
ncbi:hypothetical protein SAMN02745866_03247 [Alteromonadaceae bacterium Bs31]|nr:hypothetical protein SAMN02745866_03247 [Alteromonadaceae bacterium Bs31]